jgi:hypothetical protein
VCAGQHLFVATLEAYDDFGFYISVRQIVRQFANKPLQLWLPFLGPSINFEDVCRDARRAFEEWSGELTVWLLPEINKPARWMLEGIPNLAVPSESFDRIDIAHVSEGGRVYAPSTSGRLGRTVDRLLETWLNVSQRRGLSLVRARESLVVPSPSVTSAGVYYGPRKLEFEPGAYMPFESVDKESMNVGMRWPLEGSPATISPDAESLRRFALKNVSGADVPEAVTSTGDRALRVFLEWIKPLDRLMGVLSGVDDINCQVQMAELARSSRANPKEALAKARRLAGPPRTRTKRASATSCSPRRTKGYELQSRCVLDSRKTSALKTYSQCPNGKRC